MEPVIDIDRIRRDLGELDFAAFEQSLYDQWAATVYFFKKKLANIKAASDRIERSAEQATGFRNTVQLDPFGFACLERYHCGWQQDAQSFEKDLARYHPECVVKVNQRTNFVGWSRSLNDPVRGQRHCAEPPPSQGRRVASPVRITLTDKRGNAA